MGEHVGSRCGLRYYLLMPPLELERMARASRILDNDTYAMAGAKPKQLAWMTVQLARPAVPWQAPDAGAAVRIATGETKIGLIRGRP